MGCKMSKPRRILAYGDSLTAGYTMVSPHTREYSPWAPHVAAALGIPIDHVGMSGWTTKQMLDNQALGLEHHGLGRGPSGSAGTLRGHDLRLGTGHRPALGRPRPAGRLDRSIPRSHLPRESLKSKMKDHGSER